MSRLPWASATVTLVILVATLTPGAAVPKVGFDGADLIVHVGTFALWGLIVSRELSSPRGAVLGGLALGITTEILQLFIPGRSFSLWDLAADSVGLAVGVSLALLWGRRTQDRLSNSARAAGESHASAD